MYTVYGSPRSRTLRVTWTLEEIGAPYDIVLTGPASREAAVLSPMAKIPVLEDDDFQISESAAICLYLADQHPEAGLAPQPGTQGRARLDEMCFFALTEVEEPLWTLSKHTFALPKDKRCPPVLDTAKWEFQRSIKAFEKRLEGQSYAVGDAFSVADILFGHILSWARLQKLELGSEVRDYSKRIWSRPARERAVERERAAVDA